HALGAEAPDASSPARLDRSRDLLLGLERLGDDGLGRGGARRLLHEARGGRLREPRGLGTGALELALDAAGQPPLPPPEAGEAFREHPGALLRGLPPLGVEAFALAARRLALPLELALRVAEPLERLLRFGLGALAPLPLLSEERRRAFEHRLRQPALARNRERVAAAGEARVQPVCRPARLLVELHRRGQRIGPRRGERLDRRQVRRHERAAAALDERLEVRARDRAAL